MSQLTWLLIENVLLPAAFAAMGGWMNVLFSIPILGPWLKGKIVGLIKGFYDKGVISLKVSILDGLDEKAKKGYEPMIELLREAQNKEFLSEEEELEYEKHLKEMVQNHPGVVNG